MTKYITQRVTCKSKKMLLVYGMHGTLQATKTFNFSINDEAYLVLNVSRSDCIELSETSEISSKDFNFYKKYPNLIK